MALSWGLKGSVRHIQKCNARLQLLLSSGSASISEHLAFFPYKGTAAVLGTIRAGWCSAVSLHPEVCALSSLLSLGSTKASSCFPPDCLNPHITLREDVGHSCPLGESRSHLKEGVIWGWGHGRVWAQPVLGDQQWAGWKHRAPPCEFSQNKKRGIIKPQYCGELGESCFFLDALTHWASAVLTASASSIRGQWQQTQMKVCEGRGRGEEAAPPEEAEVESGACSSKKKSVIRQKESSWKAWQSFSSTIMGEHALPYLVLSGDGQLNTVIKTIPICSI